MHKKVCSEVIHESKEKEISTTYLDSGYSGRNWRCTPCPRKLRLVALLSNFQNWGACVAVGMLYLCMGYRNI
jgi:hypothetical protein